MTVARISVLSPAALDRELATERDYWLDKLGGELEPCGIPLDYRRPSVAAPREVTHRFDLEAATAARVLELAAGNRSLVFALLTSAVKVCLSRYGGRQDVVVGTAIHQAHAEVAALNRVLALRDRVAPEMEVRQLLRAVKTTFAEAVENQKFPFDRILDLLAVEVPKHRAPLFDVVVTLDGLHDREHTAPLAADVEVRFAVTDAAAGDGAAPAVAVELSYRGDLYRRRTMEIFAQHMAHVTAQMVERPDARVGDLELVDGARLRDFVAAAAGPVGEHGVERTAGELFADAAAAAPQAVALRCADGDDEGSEWTFAELARRADALAAELLRRGTGRGRPVAVHLGRSPELVVALLASLRAGAVFVPLDPEHPAARLRFVLEDCGAELLLTTAAVPALDLSGLDGVAVLELGAVTENADARPADPAPAPVPPTPDDLAYLIYTSGSTGVPKGVAVQHRALADYLGWAAQVYLRGETATFGLYTSPAFDLTVTSLLLPLVTGNRLVIYGEETVDLHRVMDDGLVEVAKVTPSHLALIRDRDCRGSAVRRIIVGGEAFESALARRIHDRFGGGVELYNEYGPTEATVGCMIHRYEPSQDRRGFVPIGLPAANAQVHLLDAGLAPVAENVVGAMYLGGVGLAMGYVGRPALTAERFVPNPFAGGGERLYCTGDRARRLPEGGLEFLGRDDDQIKFHGYRIELNEIRCALNDHPAVRDSVVRVAGEGDGQVLVAYYAARQEQEPEALRDFLAGRLIEATVPNLFVHLRRLPLTLNGKINHRALPSLEEARDRVRRVYAAPRTPVEEMLAVLWSEVLGVERVGLHDSFFELGGHSLLATRVVSRLREQIGVEVPLSRLFEARTLTSFASVVEELRRLGEGGEAPPVRAVARDGGGLPLSFAQQRLWVLDRLDPGTAGYNILSALRLDGDLRPAVLSRALDEVVRRHEALRTVFREDDGEPRQHFLPPGPVPLPRIDLTALPEERRQGALDAVMARQAGTPFDLAEGPLLRARLVRLGDDAHALLLTMHHVVSDGWSLSLLIDELVRLYAAFSRGEASPLPEPALQYADFAVWQRDWLQGDVLQRQLDHWRQRIVGMPPLELPTDRPRPPMQSFRGGVVSTTVPKAVATQLKALANAEGATLFAVLLAAFEALLGRWSGQDRFAVGTFIAGRNRSEVENLIGFFINNLVLEADLGGAPTFRQVVARARRDALAAYAHQDVPFEKLLEELDVPRDLSRTPVFQAMFVYQNLPAPSLTMPGVEVSMLPVATRRSNFDLTLWMYETEDGLRASFHYAAALFDEATVGAMLRRLADVLSRAAADPDQPLGALTAARGDEARQVQAWSLGAAPPTAVEAVQRAVARHAAADPSRPAVVTARDGGGETVISYGELNRRAAALAARLKAAGALPETPVAVLLERTPELIVALLGVLRSGAYYVPLDPTLPAPRLQAMVDDLGIDLVVTDPAQRAAHGAAENLAGVELTDVPTATEAAGELAAGAEEAGAEKVPGTGSGTASKGGGKVPGTGSREGAGEAAGKVPGTGSEGLSQQAFLPPEVAPERLAYAIYTSGSTGRPKAVGVPHGSLAAYVAVMGEELGVGPADRVLQFASVSFDTAAEEIFTALTRGAALVLRDADMLSSVAGFLAACGERRVSVLDLPTAFWNQAMAEEELRLPESVRLVIIGGERALPDRWRAWRRRVDDGVRLLNTYGPTEATIVKTFADLGGEEAVGEAPIGRPIPGAAAWVVGRDGELVPPGVPGELLLGESGGARGLARGYLGQAAATAAAFVPDGFGDTAGGRLYRSGDLVRWRNDGRLAFLGRVDHQVKVRGFRVELGEIETALAAHPAVAEAVAALAPGAAGVPQLAAWVTPVAGAAPTPAELRTHLRGELPDYMVPTALAVLDHLPKLPSGKVDRRALPAPDAGRDEAVGFVAPRTPEEEAMVEIWKPLLGRDRIGVYDNFFDLGGHSLLATQIVARIRKAMGVDVPLRRFFEAPTVAELTLVVEEILIEELEELSEEEARALLEGAGAPAEE